MRTLTRALILAIAVVGVATPDAGRRLQAQSRGAPPAPQKLDAEYGARIKEYLQDPRISTELVLPEIVGDNQSVVF